MMNWLDAVQSSEGFTMESDEQSTSEYGLLKEEKSSSSKQGIVHTKSRIGKYIAYLPVLLGAIFIYWSLQPGKATPELDQTFRIYVLGAYGIGVLVAARFIKPDYSPLSSTMVMLAGGIGCGVVVFFAFVMFIASVF